MLIGCTGGNAVVDAISSGTLEQPDWSLGVLDRELFISRIVGSD